MQFSDWLATFVEEKQLDLSEHVKGKDCTLQVGDVLSAMNSTTEDEQRVIKDTLVLLDFQNRDVMSYIRWLGKSLGKEYKIGIG